jgi:beta-galactosidase
MKLHIKQTYTHGYSRIHAAFTPLLFVLLAACGGGGTDSGPVEPPVTPQVPPVVAAPTITAQPLAVTATAGQAASFTVAATGTGLSYQWKLNGVDIPGATAASYQLPTVDAADSGAQLTVVVSNAAGSVTSTVVALKVDAVVVAPTMTNVAPTATPTLDGTTLVYTANANGTEPFSYAWKRNGVVIADATAKTYTTPLLTLADSGVIYTVTVTNPAAWLVEPTQSPSTPPHRPSPPTRRPWR